jgi:carnitine 3-dehydrogenase
VIQRVAVIGAGTIGASWATYFLARGLEVSAYDPSPDGEAFVRRFADTAWPTLQTLGWVTPGANEQRLRFCREIGAALEGAQFVQESGPEREGLKIALFAEMDAALSGDAVIASSSSGLPISRVTEKCRQPQRCVVGHPFNPPHLGKHPIHIKKEVRGHVANRLQAALWREAIHLVIEGVVSVADVDAAIAYGPGLRWALMGPHLTFHLAGGEGGMAHFMSHLGAGPVQSWMDDLGAPRLTAPVQQTIIEGVAAEAGSRSIADLQKWRDRKLIEILKASASP